MDIKSVTPPRVFIFAVVTSALIFAISPHRPLPLELQSLQAALMIGVTSSIFHAIPFVYGYLKFPGLLLHVLVLSLGFILTSRILDMIAGVLPVYIGLTALAVHIAIIVSLYQFLVRKVKSKKS